MMSKKKFTTISFILLSILTHSYGQKQKISFTGQAQGTSYLVTYYAVDSLIAQHQLDSLFLRIDESLSLYKPGSLINQFNASDSGIYGDTHLITVLNAAIRIFKETDGLFDPSILPLTEAWGFAAKSGEPFPDSAEVRDLVKCINANLIVIHENFIGKKKPCVRIDLNGIAQGYSVDLIASLLEDSDIRDYIVELGGEIRIRGRRYPEKTKMSIGIESPSENPEFGFFQKVIYPDSGAITTSGSYRRFREQDGKRIHHLIDPHTGYNIENEMICVTVYAPDAITADGYDNALMLMGVDRSLTFLKSHPELHAFFIYINKNGRIAEKASPGFLRLFKP